MVFVEELTSGKSIAFFNQAPTRRDMAEIAWSPDCSVLTFEATADELEAALGSLEGGATFISSKLLKTLAPQSDAVRLSPREADVARLLVQGLSNSEIAERLVISPHTVRSHLQAMTTRLEVSNRGKLAVKIREMKLV
ncbi:MAG: response regulator transcription factor [Dehalococcoidia bacterium]